MPNRRSFLALFPALVLFGLSAAQAQSPQRLLLYGDSLMAGYGLSSRDGFEGQLSQALIQAGQSVQIINASVSGETSAGGVARLDWTLSEPVEAVILCLGANDGLRGLDPVQLERNLITIITRFQKANVRVLLAGMRAPRNFGPAYTEPFDAIYPKLATQFNIPFYPFFLEGVATDPALNQADGLHPNAFGVATIVRGIMPQVLTLLHTPPARRTP